MSATLERERTVTHGGSGPKFGVIRFPGSNCDQDAFYIVKDVLERPVDYVWHQETRLDGYDVIIIPGGFSYGDYLRTGAVARFAPIMEAVRGTIGELDREENRLLALRNADATRSAAAAIAGLAVFTLGILVLAVAVFYFIRREIAVREQTIAQQKITEQRLHLQANAIESSVNGILITDAAKPDHPLADSANSDRIKVP